MKYLKKFNESNEDKNRSVNESWFDKFKGVKHPMNRVSEESKDLRGGDLAEYLKDANEEEIFDDIINNFDKVTGVSRWGFTYKGVQFYIDKFWPDTHSIYYIYGPHKKLPLDDWYKRYISSDEYFHKLYNLHNKKFKESV